MGVLCGVSTNSTNYLASFAIGLARITGSQYLEDSPYIGGGRRDDIIPVLGKIVEIQLFLRLERNIGIGVDVFDNSNSIRSFDGVTVALQFGRWY